MTFVHPLLLGGLVLVGIPVLVHLIMRQKPKYLLFPALRFLLQRHRTNQRKLQLRHLLLLLLRMVLVALICLALARPKIFSERLNITGDRPMAAVFLFDTSQSMEYVLGGRSRLDEAKGRALELLSDLPDGSRVAVLDSAEQGGEFTSISLARERINGLEIRPANHAVTRQLVLAYDLFAKLEEEQDKPEEAPLPFLYVFSDRTTGCWDSRQLENLQHLRDRLPPPGVYAVFVDVGVAQPVDLAISKVDMPAQSVPANKAVVIQATVQATGTAADATVICAIDGEATPEKKPIKLEAGQPPQVITFERSYLKQGPHQAVIFLKPDDKQLPFDNTRFVTFEVRHPRRVLTIADDKENAALWQAALEAEAPFTCDVITTSAASDLGMEDLARYKAVCLLSVAKPDHDLWDKLKSYVAKGGGLAVIPGGPELSSQAYNKDDKAQWLLPGTLERIVATKDENGVGWRWQDTTYQHPLLKPFQDWNRNLKIDFVKFSRTATRYWEVKLHKTDAAKIISYADKESRPALAERLFDRTKVHGRVLLFTTVLDRRRPRWHDYMENSFYVVLAQLSVGYLAGDAEEGSFNYLCGQSVAVVLPVKQRTPIYTVKGPGLGAAESIVQRAEDQNELQINQAVMPGNYQVYDGNGNLTACFSLNVPPEESQLERVPADQIEALFGPNALLPLDRHSDLRKLLKSHWSQPVELFGWLMILLLLLLALENLLANKFYRQEPAQEMTG